MTEQSHTVTAGQLRQYVDSYERTEVEKKELADHQKDIMAEAKSNGYCVKTIRKVIARRKMDGEALAEEEAMIGLYEEALGL